MNKNVTAPAILLAAALLAACGGSSSPTATVNVATTPGTLSVNPPFRIASLDAAALQAALSATAAGAQLLALTDNPVCGVDFYYLKFMTLGGAGEMTQSSGALMVPTGAAPTCSGPRPIVEYAHGPWTNQAANIANITDPSNTEGALLAAMFAAQGYIVVAPNYAGYDISTLGYHPFLDAKQQSGEMMDILAAARTAEVEAFVNTGSSSEYGLKRHPPREDEWLEPNSHYAVTKAAGTHLTALAAAEGLWTAGNGSRRTTARST